MARNKIYAIVEGHGEAEAPTEGTQPAVTVLIAKLLQDLQCWTLFPAKKPPWRMRSSGDYAASASKFAPGKLESLVRAHTRYPDCAALLVLLDMDDDCPKEQGPALAERIRAIEPLPFSVVVVCATREYEAWFLASLESIHPGHTYPGEPEAIRAAKGWLNRHFDYREARDQSAYTRAAPWMSCKLGRTPVHFSDCITHSSKSSPPLRRINQPLPRKVTNYSSPI